MDNIPLPTQLLPCQLLPCLAIPFVELFPNLCLGWFTPPSLNLAQYKKMWYLRVSLQLIAWFPVFEMLLPMCPEGEHFSLLVLGTASCVSFRNYLMKKQIEHVVSTPLWNTNLPQDKRKALFVVITSAKSTDINDFDVLVTRFVNFPSKIALAVISGIVHLLHRQLDEGDRLKLIVALATICIGGIGIGGFRHGNFVLDCFFRCMFSAGFTTLLHYLVKASDIFLIKSIS